jgi:hypothetical protein
MTDYIPRKWKTVTLHQSELNSIPLDTNVIPMSRVCALDSQMAANLVKRGVTPFYYDYEQIEAGFPVAYGLGNLGALTQDFVFGDFGIGYAGALVMELTNVDIETGIFTLLVEDI